jgi:hypothetical protein
MRADRKPIVKGWVIWAVWFVLLIAAVSTWGAWGFLALLLLAPVHWLMRRIDPEGYAKEQARLDRGDWWG